MAQTRFSRFAWGLLTYNLAVILGGAYVRASVSGDGCGEHWPTCNGSLVPMSGRLATFIEFSHRASSGLLLPLILVLVVWAFRAFPRGHVVRKAATAGLLLTLSEALLGAGLVLFRLVAHNQSVSRAIVMPAHLVTTLLLLMSLTLTAWWASGGSRPKLRGQGAMGWALGIGLFAALLLGVSGAIAALGDTLFPAASLAEGLRKDLDPGAHFLISLRVFHPLLSLSTCIYILLVGGLALRLRPSPQVKTWAGAVGTMFLVQMGAGLLNLVLLAPVWMQLVHLLLADLLWISLVLLTASALAEGVPQVEATTETLVSTATRAVFGDYVALTKPRVISLLLFTVLTAMFIAAGSENRPWPSAWVFLMVSLGFYMSAGAANTINMVLERDLDVRMARTSSRPTVTQKVSPRTALQFAMLMLVGSFTVLWWAANLLTAMLALAGLVFYVIVYTLLLKRRTWRNIVIGGAAGAIPPLVGWAAVTGDLSLLAWCLFGIIFLWTPVHFWALAIVIKDDYARAGVPMLPVVYGDRATVYQIGIYALLTLGISVSPILMRQQDGRAMVGWVYLGVAALLNAGLIARSFKLYLQPGKTQARSLFKYSMVYLALLFLAMAIDRAYRV
ncbi:MAG TPA: heme o synthase [Armatimonadota bacterium]|jgi:protoheme IX farnesyltransferase